jgi:hypothetical protein
VLYEALRQTGKKQTAADERSDRFAIDADKKEQQLATGHPPKRVPEHG